MNLSHLYLSPLEKCNLNCKICYTSKVLAKLSCDQLKDFVERYCLYLSLRDQTLDTVTLCGGEVFLLPWLSDFLNGLTEQKIIIEIITNGTIDRLQELSHPNLVNLIISLDGLEKYHDSNRGQGSFQKTWRFLKKAIDFGFHIEIFSVITAGNLNQINRFERYLQQKLGFLPEITYHPRKSLNYLKNHPVSNQMGEVTGFDFLSPAQLKELASNKKVFPPIKLGCHQVAVMSDGQVYACCEGIKPIGDISDKIEQIVDNYQKRIKNPKNFPNHCQGCVEPDFVCGLTQEYFDL